MAGSLYSIYLALQTHFGSNPTWWPIFGDDAPFEMMLGAVLVQQTRWETVEGAIVRLHQAGLLNPPALAQADVQHVTELLRPTAFHTQKAPGIMAISAYLCARYNGSAATLLAQPPAILRPELLSLPRIGPETADVIMLYAGGHPQFVVDDYTRRLLGRIDPQLPDHYPQSSTSVSPRVPGATQRSFDWQRTRYAVVQQLIVTTLTSEMEALPCLAQPDDEYLSALFGDYHALINEQCVRYCLARNPRCNGPPARRVYSVQEGRESYLERHDGCPLRPVCAYYQLQRREVSLC